MNNGNNRENFKNTKIDLKQVLKGKILSNIKNKRKEFINQIRNSENENVDPYKQYILNYIKGKIKK
jgi:tRNA uridine 5-carbamoylmethylation protein Kti12